MSETFVNKRTSSQFVLFIKATAADGSPVSFSTGDYVEITGVQLELGKVATPFEHRSYGEELALCQRYYEVSSGVNWYLTGLGSGAEVYLPNTWKVTKRATPTMSNSASSVVGTVNGVTGSTDGYYWRIVPNSSGVVGAWAGSKVIGDAEL